MSLSLAGSGQISGFDAGLSGFGGLVAVKSAIFTGTQTAAVASLGNLAVTDLSITHEVADASNKLIISAYLGSVATTDQRGNVGIAVAEDGTLINVADADGIRARSTAGGFVSTASALVVAMPSVTFVHTPGAGSKTYTVRAVNLVGAETIYINRNETNSNDGGGPRATSGLVIMEVSV